MPSSVDSSPARRNASPPSTTAATTAAAAVPRDKHLIAIPLIYDSLTFDARQEKWIKDLERKVAPCIAFRFSLTVSIAMGVRQ